MRTARIKLDGQAYYHVMTHLVDGAQWLGPAEKEQFRKLMRAYETFYGVLGTSGVFWTEAQGRRANLTIWRMGWLVRRARFAKVAVGGVGTSTRRRLMRMSCGYSLIQTGRLWRRSRECA